MVVHIWNQNYLGGKVSRTTLINVNKSIFGCMFKGKMINESRPNRI
jgi:hypothetical protein